MPNYEIPALVTALTVLLLFAAEMNVGRCRAKYKIAAPATTGDPAFERVFRVQMNTLENVVVFLPALWLFSIYISPTWAGVLGAIWLVGRVLYWKGYMEAANKRGMGYGISFLPLVALVLGGLVGVILKMI